MDAMEYTELTDLHRVVEALVFATEAPITEAAIAEVIGEVLGATIEEEAITVAVATLNAMYAQSGSILRIEGIAGGYRMATDTSMAPYLNVFFRQERKARLSRSLMEALAIIAYKQPATKPEVDAVRGVDSDYAVRRLLEHNLIEIIGRSESLGKPLLYGTTSTFLERFGLASLDDLPTLREIEELLNEPAFSKERAELLLLKDLLPPESTDAADEATP
ncbi:MAG: SMC-Scp complex subunit ScpB [Rhodothermales bacterium]